MGHRPPFMHSMLQGSVRPVTAFTPTQGIQERCSQTPPESPENSCVLGPVVTLNCVRLARRPRRELVSRRRRSRQAGQYRLCGISSTSWQSGQRRMCLTRRRSFRAVSNGGAPAFAGNIVHRQQRQATVSASTLTVRPHTSHGRFFRFRCLTVFYPGKPVRTVPRESITYSFPLSPRRLTLSLTLDKANGVPIKERKRRFGVRGKQVRVYNVGL